MSASVRLLAISSAALAVLALAGLAGAVVGTDPAGDSGTAPDITRVEVTADAARRFTFGVSLPNRASGLEANELLLVFLDTDRNSSTGDLGGDYRILLGSVYNLSRWTGSAWERLATPTSRARRSGDVYIFEFDAADFGSPTTFNFSADARRIVNDRIERSDRAPDRGDYTYSARSCAVPNVKGKTLAAARKAIGRAGCRVGKVTKRASKKKKGRVIAQSPRAGTTSAENAKVALVVSRGRKK
jgi:hypothetical protein